MNLLGELPLIINYKLHDQKPIIQYIHWRVYKGATYRPYSPKKLTLSGIEKSISMVKCCIFGWQPTLLH